MRLRGTRQRLACSGRTPAKLSKAYIEANDPDGCVEPSPRISEEHGEIFSGMANLRDSKRMIQLIAPDALIDQESVEQLESAAGGN